MGLNMEPQAPITEVRNSNDSKPAVVKAAVITAVIAWTLLFGFVILVTVFNIIGGEIKHSLTSIAFILLNIILLDTLTGVITSMVVLAQHKRWNKTGVIGLISNGLLLFLMLIIYLFLFAYFFG